MIHASALACLIPAGLVGGCAQPRGPLFEPVDPPVVWPSSPEQPRIRLVGSIRGSQDLRADQPASEVFKAALRGPRAPIEFGGPTAVAVRDGRWLAVADAAGAAVHVIDLHEREHRAAFGWAEERLSKPAGVAWVGTRLLLADAGRHEIIEFDAQCNFVRRFGQDALTRPVGIAYVAARNRLYVADGDSHCLAVFDLAGALERRIGQRGTAPGEFNYPSHICSAGQRLLVADAGNFRVQILDLDGNSLETFGRKGDGAGDFALPKGVAFDSDGHAYVVDAQFENVQIFDDQGRVLLAFGQEGDGPGDFSLPAGMAIDANDRIWIADSANRRIQVFDYLRATR